MGDAGIMFPSVCVCPGLAVVLASKYLLTFQLSSLFVSNKHGITYMISACALFAFSVKEVISTFGT